MTITQHHLRKPVSVRSSALNPQCVPQPSPEARSTVRRPFCANGQPAGSVRSSGVVSGKLLDPQPDWEQYCFEFLIERVLQNQHAGIREQLLPLQALSAEAAKQQGKDRRERKIVSNLLRSFVSELAASMVQEESIFPILLQLELAYIGESPGPGYPKRVRATLDALSTQHRVHLRKLDTICQRAGCLSAPSEPASPGRDLSERLEILHRTLLNLYSIENKVLFARAAQMEAEIFC